MSYYLVGALYSFQLILKYAIISVVAGEKMNTGGLHMFEKELNRTPSGDQKGLELETDRTLNLVEVSFEDRRK